MSTWSLLGFGAAAAARATLTNIVPLADVTHYVVDGTNYAKFSRPGSVFFGNLISAAIANVIEGDFRKDSDRNYMRFSIARDQTTQFLPSNMLTCRYPVSPNERLEMRANNNNNSQIEGFYYGYGTPTPLTFSPAIQPHRYVRATMTGTLTANLPWSAGGAVTWSETFDPNKRYRVVGMSAQSATLYAARIVFPDSIWRPGVPGSDTVGLTSMLYGDFGSFIGNTPPTFEFSASGADTAEVVTLAII